MSYLARHSVAIFAITTSLFGLGVGASNVYQINLDEQHSHITEG